MSHTLTQLQAARDSLFAAIYSDSTDNGADHRQEIAVFREIARLAADGESMARAKQPTPFPRPVRAGGMQP